MAYLLTLPNELLDLIFGLCCTTELQTLSTVCRKLHLSVLPSLYHHPTLWYDELQDHHPQPLQTFLRTIVKHPAWASHVKSLSFLSECPWPRWKCLGSPEVESPDAEWYEALSAMVPVRDETLKIPQSARTFSMDAAVALLLCLLPNLRSARISIGPFGCSQPQNFDFAPAVTREILSSTASKVLGHRFEFLEEFEWFGPQDETCFEETQPPLSGILWLFSLPRMKSTMVKVVE
ncbi:MAG: hypothetical protein Q9218_007181 [Villophora microphyllina]